VPVSLKMWYSLSTSECQLKLKIKSEKDFTEERKLLEYLLQLDSEFCFLYSF
jgi:hypothetical protein